VLVLAALVLSALDTTLLDTDPNSATYGAGLFDALPSNQGDKGANHDTHELWDGLTQSQIADPKLSTQAFIKRLRNNSTVARVAGHWPAIDDGAATIGQWIAEAADKTKYEAEIVESVRDNTKAAKQLVEAFAKNSSATISQDISAISFDQRRRA
jgi:hypothetical protein